MAEKYEQNICHWGCQYIIGNTLCSYNEKITIIPPINNQCPYNQGCRINKADQGEQKKPRGIEKKTEPEKKPIMQSNPWMDIF